MAGAVAVEHAGGPHIPMTYGRVDPPTEQLLALRSSKRARNHQDPSRLYPCPMAPYNDHTSNAEIHVRNVMLNRLGFSCQEIVALMGAHTLGRAFSDRSGACPMLHCSGDQGATQYTRQTCIARVR